MIQLIETRNEARRVRVSDLLVLPNYLVQCVDRGLIQHGENIFALRVLRLIKNVLDAQNSTGLLEKVRRERRNHFTKQVHNRPVDQRPLLDAGGRYRAWRGRLQRDCPRQLRNFVNYDKQVFVTAQSPG